MRIETFEWELDLKKNEIDLRQKQSISSINRLKMDCRLLVSGGISTAIMNEWRKDVGEHFPRENKRSVSIFYC